MPHEDLHPVPKPEKAVASGSGQPISRNPVLRRGLTAVAGLLAVAASVTCASAPASAASGSFPVAAAPAAGPPATPVGTPYLPEPTGPHPVGTTSLYLKDVSRPDPWVPTAKARELMVSLWYPAKSRGGRPAPYMTPKESELVLQGTGMTDVPPDALSRTRTNSFADANPAGRAHTLPLVVLSPGFTWPSSSLTALAEELASRAMRWSASITRTRVSRRPFPMGG